MPIVTIQVTREGTSPGVDHVTAEEKAVLYKGVTDLLWEVLKKPPESTFVIFEEVELGNWARGGVTVPEFRRQAKAEPG
jgi:4-oxalocrotonate tautomerase